MKRCILCANLTTGSYCPKHGLAANQMPRGWAKIRERILKRDGYRCTLCGGTGPLDIDHIRGRGHNDDASLRTVCASYNRGGRCA